MSDHDIRIEQIEQPLTPSLIAKITALWDHEGAVIADRHQRLSQVLLLAWAGETLAGVSSIKVTHHSGIDKPLFIQRGIVGAEFRRQGVSYLLYQATVETLEDRFDQGLDTRAIGVFVEVEADLAAELPSIFCSFSHTHSKQNRPVESNLVGITEEGYPHYIYYFKNASLFMAGPSTEERIDKLADDGSGTTLQFCWRTLTSAQEEGLIDLWLSSGVINDRETCLERLPQVAALALDGEKIVGIGSIFDASFSAARANVLGFRSFISPDARGSLLATKLLNRVFHELNKTYADDPTLKNKHGIAYVLQNDDLNKSVHLARSPLTNGCLAGYINGLQLRLKYFDGASIDMTDQS